MQTQNAEKTIIDFSAIQGTIDRVNQTPTLSHTWIINRHKVYFSRIQSIYDDDKDSDRYYFLVITVQSPRGHQIPVYANKNGLKCVLKISNEMRKDFAETWAVFARTFAKY